MTSYTLLQFPDRLVLVSGKQIRLAPDKLNDIPDVIPYLWFEGSESIVQNAGGDLYKGTGKVGYEVIAGHGSLPSVDVTAISETIGWVDVESLAIAHWHSEYLMAKNEDNKQYIVNDFKAGFHKAQELNKNKFTEEDMASMLRWFILMKDTETSNIIADDPKGSYSRFVKAYLDQRPKQHPKQWSVEVEMIDNFPGTGERVRITNNTIKVTKVIEQ